MAGGQQEEEEECEDCKLQTILRVNPNIEPSSVGDILTKPWQIFTEFPSQNLPLNTLSLSEQEIANQCFSGENA